MLGLGLGSAEQRRSLLGLVSTETDTEQALCLARLVLLEDLHI